jgi:hypothetical protein
MATFSKELLSGSSQGRGILVAATATPGTTIHATGTSSTIEDEIWLYAHNSSASGVKLTVEFGGTTSPNDLVEFTVAAESGLYLIVPGLVLTGTGSVASTVRAFAATTNVINIFGYVNRITP